MCERWGQTMATFKPDSASVEINQYNQLLADELSKHTPPHIPIVPVENLVSKAVRIRRLGPFLSQKKIRFRRTQQTRMLVEQLREFPNGTHDDGPDALEMALRLLIDEYNASSPATTLHPEASRHPAPFDIEA